MSRNINHIQKICLIISEYIFNSCAHVVLEFGVDYYIIILVCTQINVYHFFEPPDIYFFTR